ncbi:YceI family protein [Paraburkholderia sp. HP33-1]|uniref:YceI family protein n=1 Tax=Paraburkholderia sp. HP33-1 TaxID=2883243 RepID=UPI001F364BF6|nr:YceI family protein [Paraburkholderia sp. HP33-1]
MTNPTAWAVDPAHTHIGFSVRHLGLTRTPGVFKRFVVQLWFADQNIEDSSVTFEVETASIDTALEMRDEHLRGADWFDVHTHPTAVFVSRIVRRDGNDRYVIEGELSLRGVTLPVTFDATLTGRAVNPWTQMPVVGFEAAATISRSAYGMGAFPMALSDGVQLKIATELTVANDANQ